MIISSSRIAPVAKTATHAVKGRYALVTDSVDDTQVSVRIRAEVISPADKRIGEFEAEIRDNTDIARQLGIAPRTVKACFNHLYLRFGITSGVKRVKLATFLFRSQLCSQVTLGNATQANTNTPDRLNPPGCQRNTDRSFH